MRLSPRSRTHADSATTRRAAWGGWWQALSVALVCLLTLSTAAAAEEEQEPLDRPHETPRGDIGGAIRASLRLAIIEHGTRVAFQEKTRRELGGHFFADYARSVRIPRQWNDTDAWWVNYIGHPIHGAAAGYIWLDHERGAPAEFSNRASYWSSRSRAMAWSAVYSLQFELGIFSEASIGNVGMQPETTGWVDHVVTPTGAFGWIVAEDVLDRYVTRWVERRTGNRLVRAAVRLALNPGRALSNGASGRVPWHRDGRPLRGR